MPDHLVWNLGTPSCCETQEQFVQGATPSRALGVQHEPWVLSPGAGIARLLTGLAHSTCCAQALCPAGARPPGEIEAFDDPNMKARSRGPLTSSGRRQRCAVAAVDWGPAAWSCPRTFQRLCPSRLCDTEQVP